MDARGRLRGRRRRRRGRRRRPSGTAAGESVGQGAVQGKDTVAAVHLVVLGEVVRAGESLIAHMASVGLHPRVRASVASEFVRSGESPRAPWPRAHERLLPRVAPQVSLQVRGLGVDLPAARVSALEHPPLIASWVLPLRGRGERRGRDLLGRQVNGRGEAAGAQQGGHRAGRRALRERRAMHTFDFISVVVPRQENIKYPRRLLDLVLQQLREEAASAHVLSSRRPPRHVGGKVDAEGRAALHAMHGDVDHREVRRRQRRVDGGRGQVAQMREAGMLEQI